MIQQFGVSKWIHLSLTHLFTSLLPKFFQSLQSPSNIFLTSDFSMHLQRIVGLMRNPDRQHTGPLVYDPDWSDESKWSKLEWASGVQRVQRVQLQRRKLPRKEAWWGSWLVSFTGVVWVGEIHVTIMHVFEVKISHEPKLEGSWMAEKIFHNAWCRRFLRCYWNRISWFHAAWHQISRCNAAWHLN